MVMSSTVVRHHLARSSHPASSLKRPLQSLCGATNSQQAPPPPPPPSQHQQRQLHQQQQQHGNDLRKQHHHHHHHHHQNFSPEGSAALDAFLLPFEPLHPPPPPPPSTELSMADRTGAANWRDTNSINYPRSIPAAAATIYPINCNNPLFLSTGTPEAARFLKQPLDDFIDPAASAAVGGGGGALLEAQTQHLQQHAQQQQQQQRRLFSSVPDADHLGDEQMIRSLAGQKATPLSLRDIHAFCQSTNPDSRLMQARFLHREVPIRFAQRVLELRHLPYGLSETAPVIEAVGWYARIMRELVEYPAPEGREGEEAFATFLSSLLMDHTCVPQALSRGVLELKERGEVGVVQRHRIDRILDNFFISRISLRFLVDTYISSKKNKPGFSGVIQSECSPTLVAWRAAADVDRLCRFHMGTAPTIEVFGREQDTFTTVPSHLYYILRELLKNSCRATVEHGRGTRPGQKLPPVKVIVARGKEDMTIKIVDEGGGIRRSELQHVWSYMYSTAPKPTPCQLSGVPLDHMSGMRLKEEASLLSAPEPKGGTTFAFAGYGMGLPLSRLYARYFGGSLKLRPMEGYGTDAYVHLHRLKTNSEELLPISLEETLRVMADDGRVNVTATRSWKTPPKDDSVARELLRTLGRGL